MNNVNLKLKNEKKEKRNASRNYKIKCIEINVVMETNASSLLLHTCRVFYTQLKFKRQNAQYFHRHLT